MALLIQGHFGLGPDDAGLGAVDGALHLGFGPGPEDHDVVKGAGGHQGAAQALGEHEHRGEDENYQGHAGGGEKGGEPPGQEVAIAVGERNRH